MDLRRWTVYRYRNLSDIELDMSDSAVLIGLNNSGKSNVLLSLRDYVNFLYGGMDDISEWFDQTRPKNEEVDSAQIAFAATYSAGVDELSPVIDSLAEETRAEVASPSMYFGEEDWEQVRQRTTGGIKIEHNLFMENGIGNEAIYVDDKCVLQWRWEFEDRNHKNTEFDLRWNDRPETDRTVSGEYYWEFDKLLDDVCKEFRTLAPIRDPEPTTKSSSSGAPFGVDPRASDLVATIDNLDGVTLDGKSLLEHITQDFVGIVEDISNITASNEGGDSIFYRSGNQEDDNEPDSKTIFLEHEYSTNDGSSVFIPLENASTGTQELLALLSRIYLTEYFGGLLLIEEPEVHLHPRAEKVVIDRINRTIQSSDATVLLSTHSENMIQAVSIERIHSVTTDDSGFVHISRGTAEGQLPNHIQAQLGQLLQTEFVIVTESAADAEILKVFFDRYFNDDEIKPLLKIDFVSCGHRGQTFEEVSAIRDCLRSFQIPFCCVFNQLGKERANLSLVISEIVELHDDEFVIWETYSIESWLLSESALESMLPTADVDPDIFESQDDPREALEMIFETQEWQYSEHRPYRPITDGVQIAKEIGMDEFPSGFERLTTRIQDAIEE